jgi:hypothetical protein
MKTLKLATSLLIIGLLLTAATPSFAQSVTPTITPKPTGFLRSIFGEGKKLLQDLRQERQDTQREIKDSRSGLRGTITQERDDLKPTITQQRLENRRQNLQTLYNEIRSMLTKRFDFLNTAKDKITAKIADRKTQGKDVSAAEAKLATYNPAVYNTDLAAFDKKFTDLLASNNPKQLVKDLQVAAKVVSTDLQDLHKILVDTVRLIIQAK